MNVTAQEALTIQNVTMEIRALTLSTLPPSLGQWAISRFDLALDMAMSNRGITQGRHLASMAFCSGFDAGGDTPMARLIGAEQDHMLAFLAGATLRDFLDLLCQNDGPTYDQQPADFAQSIALVIDHARRALTTHHEEEEA